MGTVLDNIDKDLKLKVASRFKELREKSGKNQTDFAHDYGKDKQAQYKLEAGHGASLYSINKLCLGLGITLSEFFDSPIFNDQKPLEQ